MAFPTDAFDRMVILPSFFTKSLVADLFSLSPRETLYLAENAAHDLKLQLVHLEVWLHVCLYNLPEQSLLNRLKDNITINSE